MSDNVVARINEHFLRVLLLEHLELLSVDSVPLTKTVWLRHLGGLRHLEDLQVGSDYTASFLSAFATGTSAWHEEIDDTDGVMFKALRGRKKGPTLAEVLVEYCSSVDADDVDELKGIAGLEVYWDEEGIITDEESAEQSVSSEDNQDHNSTAPSNCT
ncbi:hypothetical protein LshimejAT787_1004790 [Lyophyllum shimeji]|uniref:Uncharacterized protein n=1 Tax=Lyophyllum shimeji TaxID=47721 RepID=A0A9P3PUQ8_LYOSH|nr:hypothetical protein LshimejAT787_1004790 [Lyophyllum shimeji]